MQFDIRYGKRNITLYRTYARPLEVTPIPESPFRGRSNILFAADVDVHVLGDNFLPAYTEGDNSNVVATDTMKNVVLQQALAYEGATLEGFLNHLGRGFLGTYPQMGGLVINAREQPFAPAPIPAAGSFAPSPLLFSRGHDDQGYAELHFGRDDNGAPVLSGHRCGRLGLQLIKVSGSSFTNFARDEYTTLDDRPDRPLFISCDLFWRYADSTAALGDDLASYIDSEQMRDLAATVFHEFVSLSIQHLLHEIGRRALDRFPQLGEMSFIGQNRLWDTAFVSADNPKVKVYCDPRAPYGQLELTMRRG